MTALYLHVTPFIHDLRNPPYNLVGCIASVGHVKVTITYIYVPYVITYSIRPSPLLILPKHSPNTGETRLYRIQPFNRYIYIISTNMVGPGTSEQY